MGIFVVMGAAKPGIGEAVTQMLLHDGHSVIGTFESEQQQSANRLLSQSTANLTLRLIDHSKTQSLREFVDTLPNSINGVVIAQMHFDIRKHDDYVEDIWNTGLAVNLTMPHAVSLMSAPRVIKGGCIVTITSTEGFIGSYGAAGYAASKAAIHNLIKTHANNFGKIGVRANAIAAGWIGGVMDTDEVFNMSRRITPLGRLGEPSEIAAVTRFLLGSDASFVTGATIVADGGYTCVDTISKFEYDALDA
jgi:NAD(P)-dependent dehydrogenase (short-subunit alcohol dehydrogenase family)